jgi:hypothetical protein
LGWDAEKQREWISKARNEKPLWLHHYTTENGKNGIEMSGVIDPAYAAEGINFFSPDNYSASDEATEKLATPSKREYQIGLFMFKDADGLSDISLVGPRYGHQGGGRETSTAQPIPINGIMRMRTQWIPLTD